jgi:acid phosphatase (class A)
MTISTSRLQAALAALCLSVCPALADDAKPVPEIRPGILAGYLQRDELPDSVALLPPPPALGSAAEELDQEVARRALSMQGSDRFKQATTDADLSFPDAAGAFSCALGIGITEADTPTLYRMLRRVLTDAGRATGKAKDKYRHARPFMMDYQPTCTPKDEDALRANGSYPSGHTSAGWAWAEVLAEIAPDRAEQILERGRAFGESRIVCNVHWTSDVMEGRIVAAATVVRLHANADFLADLPQAKKEIEAARAKNLAPQRDCAFESKTLKETPWLTP